MSSVNTAQRSAKMRTDLGRTSSLKRPLQNGVGKKKKMTQENGCVNGVPPRKTVGEDASKMMVEIATGKKGGDFDLPSGGKISIPAGAVAKKDVVTCCVVSPSDRHKYLPDLSPSEKLLSEIYLLASSTNSMKKPMTLQLPFYPVDLDLNDVSFKAKLTNSSQWETMDVTVLEAKRRIVFETSSAGIFVVTSVPKREHFELPVAGCLYNARINKYITVRAPKRATDVNLNCYIEITSMNHDNVAMLKRDLPNDYGELTAISDFFEVNVGTDRDFRRAISVKLPLPDMDESIPTEDFHVLERCDKTWCFVESSLKFTKTTVSFDVKTLSKYCICVMNPTKKRKLPELVSSLETGNDVFRGEIIPFIHIQEKYWLLWCDCVRNEEINTLIDKRLAEGFRQIQKSKLIIEEEATEEKPVIIRRSWRSRKKQETKKPEVTRTDLDLSDGCSFDLEIGGNILISDEDTGRDFTGIHFFQNLPNNYRKFIIQPQQQREKAKLLLRCVVEDPDTCLRTCLSNYDYDVDPDDVRAYFYVEPEPEPEPEEEPEPEPEPVQPEPVVVAPPSPEKFTFPQTESFARLTKLTRPPRKIFKESKVLTGRSLMNIAREIEQGLTLAIYLDISDSTITGMGFDALATGLSLIDLTYKVLMLWKRRSNRLKDRQVDALAHALEEMGRPDVSEIVLEKHRLNEEITVDCFKSL